MDIITKQAVLDLKLLPARLDDLAVEYSNEPFASIPKTSQPGDGYEDISYARLANAVNRAAYWLRDQPSVSRSQGSVFAYLGPTDLRYTVLLLAALKLESAMFFPSPFNTLAAQSYLLDASNTCCFLSSPPYTKQVADILSGKRGGQEVLYVQVSSLEELLSEEPVDALPHHFTVQDRRRNPFVLLHTSGTTGMPKILALPHGYYIHEYLNQCSAFDGNITSQPFTPGCRLFTTMSLWHAGGIFYGLLKPLLNKVVTVLPPPGLPLTGHLVHACLTHAAADTLQAAPALLAEMAMDSNCASTLSKLRFIITGSGPMSQQAGDMLLSLNSNVFNYFGLTETDLLPQLPVPDVCFRCLGDGLYELIIVKMDSAVPQPCFEVVGGSEVLHSKDIFRPHPTNPSLWKWVGRLDDMITLSTGEKFFAPNIESKLASVAGVKECLIVGQGRRIPAVLLELDQTGPETDAILAAVRRELDLLNPELPQFARVRYGLIHIAAGPFIHTPKGTIKRRDTEREFQHFINKMYDALQQNRPALSFPTNTGLQDIIDYLTGVVHHAIGDGRIADQLFHTELDSMTIVHITMTVNASLALLPDPSRRVKIEPGFWYSHPSLDEAANSLQKLVNASQIEFPSTKIGIQTSKDNPCLRKLLTKYTSNFSKASIPRSMNEQQSVPLQSVLLTGSTGSLGSHLLHTLLKDPRVKRIDCFNRSQLGLKQHITTFPEDQSQMAKIHFHHVKDISHESFGLDQSTHAQLMESKTIILHNAWPVSFHLPLVAFEAHVAGTSSLLHFCRTATHSPELMFVSSLATAQKYKHESGAPQGIPEAILEDPSVIAPHGYAQGKWMGEQIINKAVQSGYVQRASIVRVGVIAGPTPHSHTATKAWRPEQFIPSMIRSSGAMGFLPASLGEQDKLRWIPVDLCARIILELVDPDHEPDNATRVFNVSNVSNAADEKTWSEDGLPLINSVLERKRPIEVVTLNKWTGLVEQYGPRPENPAFKLLHFFQDLGTSNPAEGFGSRIDMARAKAQSKTLRDLSEVKDEWIQSWLEHWGF